MKYVCHLFLDNMQSQPYRQLSAIDDTTFFLFVKEQWLLRALLNFY